MVGPEHELFSMSQANPNEFGKCSTCGQLLRTRQEKGMKTCAECQLRGRDKESEISEGE
ncbi:hypothetical protein N781_00905 [Pontibacillus halophilus JSM 076056 = DSM 19796]|uniref:DksA C4-type domain-containing protein n=1 Tax=Pontibacillus halophilus JSM 076056 = DSM 19796 TaxID=1385510 RepID=A0A0A5GKH9_9BACI|nr:hypothetical protein [Pontibacillus halophilus]KGX93791.1 hypothetical protein N781_00905 [Pontibacillus halophilus JSM 076056 = DSM 19796]